MEVPQRTEKEDETLKKIWNLVAKDLWIVLLDIVAVNAAYYLALMVRFYVNFEFRPWWSLLYLAVGLGVSSELWGMFCPIFKVFKLIHTNE